MNKLFTIGILSLLFAGGMIFYCYDNENFNLDKRLEEKDIKKINNEYYGPVQIGYNLEKFRKTGETMPEDIR